MKAIILHKPGEPEQLEYADIEDPQPGYDQVLVKLHAAALNRRDLSVRRSSGYAQYMPFIPGSDGAGVVIDTGQHANKFHTDQQVVVYPSLNWGTHTSYPSPNFEILGGPTNGTYAEMLVLPQENLFLMPQNLSFAQAAALPIAGLTTWRALITKAAVQPGERVFIPGAGSGTATFAIQIACMAGARVFVSSHSDEKIEQALALGAEAGVNYTHSGWQEHLRDLTGGGVQIVVDSVGQATYPADLDLLFPGGRLVSFGVTSGSSVPIAISTIYRKQISVLGTTMGSPAEFEAFLSAVESGGIQPVIDSHYPLAQAAQAHRHMEAQEQFGKIVLDIE
jgi:zinc-binding alcohol dehydrogenase/oxidoreductase